jgi:hypothetical protein
MRPAPADQRLSHRPLSLAALVFAAAACGGAKTSSPDAGLDGAASDGLAEAASQTDGDAVDDSAASDSGGGGSICDPSGATLAPTNDPACPPRGTNNPSAGSACSGEALRCTYYTSGGDCLPGVPYALTCCDSKWRFGISCPPAADASAD